MVYTIRPLNIYEYGLLDTFLYEAIYIPEGAPKPGRDMIKLPELQVYVKDLGSGSADYCLAAESAGRVIGAVWTRIMDDYGHIDDKTPSLAISVLEEFRGAGAGTALMQEMLKLLKEKGYAAVSLSVQKANPAVRLYRRLGFETVRETDEEYIMIRRLLPV